MVVLSVRRGARFSKDRIAMFHLIELKGLILSHTLTVMRGGVCQIQANNIWDENLSLSRGL